MHRTENILAGDAADLCRVMAEAPEAAGLYVADNCAAWQAEADRLARDNSCISLQDLYRLRARELRRVFSKLSA